MSDENRDYENDKIIVHWRPAKCIHSAVCVKGLHRVFNTKERPWINLDGAAAADIAAQIDRCPSGALSYTKKD